MGGQSHKRGLRLGAKNVSVGSNVPQTEKFMQELPRVRDSAWE